MSKKLPSKTKDLPVTHEMLLEVRNELIQRMDAGSKRVNSDTTEIKALFHQAILRFEKQRSENKMVLEALHGLSQRQDRLESEFVQVRDTTRALAKAKNLKGRA